MHVSISKGQRITTADLVSFSQLSKLFFSLWVIFICIRMILFGHLGSNKTTISYFYNGVVKRH